LFTTREEVLSRLYKIGSGAAAIGAIHILALLLSWYVQVINGSEISIEGWVIPWSRLMSLLGGLMAGVGVVVIHFIKRLKVMKIVLGSMIIIGGALAVFSPIYSYVFWLSNMVTYPRIDLGFFASAFTGFIQLGVGALVFLTPVKEEVIPTAAAPTIPPPTAPPEVSVTAPSPGPSRSATTRLVPARDVEEAICSLCLEPIAQGDAVRCSNCDAIFHRGCIDAWASVNGTCPNCKAIITES